MGRFASLSLCLSWCVAGCVIDRSPIGCPEGWMEDPAFRCVTADAAPGDSGPRDGGPDVGPRDGGNDAGRDAFVLLADASDTGLMDTGMEMPDAFMDPDAFVLPMDGGTDAFVPPVDGGSDAGRDAFVPPVDGGTDAFVPPVDGGSDAGSDAGPPPPYLQIIYTGSIPVGGGFALCMHRYAPTFTSCDPFRWTADACVGGIRDIGGGRVQCDAYAPDLARGRTAFFYPTDATGTNLCNATGCPGGPSAYDVRYDGSGRLTVSPEDEAAPPGYAPGESDFLSVMLPP